MTERAAATGPAANAGPAGGALLPGATPWSTDGRPDEGSTEGRIDDSTDGRLDAAGDGPAGGRIRGALCIHGFTGNPSSMRGVAEGFAAAGFAVELPRLPGHGTTVEDMKTTGWADWSGEVEAAYQRLAARADVIVVAGLSMGGTLTLWTALQHPTVAGIVCINPLTMPQSDEVLDMVRGMVDEGTDELPGIGSDIADPDVVESAYAGTPLVPLLELMDGVASITGRLGEITCPLLLVNSVQDHVVEPPNGDHLADHFGGPLQRILLERSYHVATLDYDKEQVIDAAVAFGQKVTT